MRTRAAQTPAPTGFTLIEVLVVLALLGMLIGMTSFAVSRYRESGRIAEARARIDTLALLLESYNDRMGSYPPGRLTLLGVPESNGVNEGIESLVAALGDKRYAGRRPDERWLGNGDEDEAVQLQQYNGSQALLEVLDPWDNPFVYIPASDYEREFTYRLEDALGIEEVTLGAARSKLTGAWHQFESFQLLSAGPDGLVGTEDDIANYEIQLQES